MLGESPPQMSVQIMDNRFWGRDPLGDADYRAYLGSEGRRRGDARWRDHQRPNGSPGAWEAVSHESTDPPQLFATLARLSPCRHGQR